MRCQQAAWLGRSAFAALFSATVLAASAHAVVVFNVVLDPATTAGGGSTSTHSGPGRWHLFALDLTPDSLGIAGYRVDLAGATAILHRSPSTLWRDADDNDHDAGFRISRTAINDSPIRASQPPLGDTPVLISGFGREAGGFAAQIPDAAGFSSTLSASWGNYNTIAPLFGQHWLFLAEGQYTVGTPPTVNPAGTTAELYNADFSIRPAEVAVPLCPSCTPPDFNGDGVADAADYVLLRKHAGTPADYNTWRAYFGQTDAASASGGEPAAFPEPATAALLGLVLLTLAGMVRRR